MQFLPTVKGLRRLNIHLRSEGCNDRGKRGRCGRASIWVNGKDLSKHRRGFNVVVLDYYTGRDISYSLYCFYQGPCRSLNP